jgi:hypothetical protein
VIDTATRKQQELNEFKSRSPQEQQAILDQKRAQEAVKNQDLAVRIQQSLQNDDPFDLSDESMDNDLSIESADLNMNS